MSDDRHHAAGLIGMTLLLVGLLGGPAPALWAQSAETPPAQGEVAPEDNPPPAVKEPSPQDRQRAYRRQKDELKEFAPSEEIRVDKAVDFPVDI
jgi:hypothetical protein